jgi:hypothetical protein
MLIFILQTCYKSIKSILHLLKVIENKIQMVYNKNIQKKEIKHN